MEYTGASRRQVLTTAGLAGALAGCTGMLDGSSDGTDETKGGKNTEIDPGETYWSFQTGGLVFAGPTIVNGTVYFGSEDRHMYAIDAETGEEYWRYQVDPNPKLTPFGRMEGQGIYSAPQVVDGRVFFGANDYNIYGLDADTGEELWRVETDSLVYGSPTYDNGTLYASARDKSMYAIDGATGETEWENANIGISGVSTLVQDGRVYTGSYSESQSPTCIDAATGDILWQLGDILTCSSPTYANETVIYGSLDEYVYGLNPQTGDIKWTVETEGPQDAASPTAKDGIAYISQYGGGLVAIDIEAGEKVWTADDTYSGGGQSPTVVGDHVVFVNQVGGVHVVDADSGEIIFNQYFDGEPDIPLVSPSIVIDGILFVGTPQDRSLHAMELPIEGTSEGTRIDQGIMNHHHEWSDQSPQELDMEVTGTIDSGNEDITEYRRQGDGPYDGWIQGVSNYENETVDMRNRDEVTVQVGAGEDGFLFEPAAILVDMEATITWEWTGKGGVHNVVSLGGIEISELTSDPDHEVSYTLEDHGWGSTLAYYCRPHRSSGMKGVVAVEETEDTVVSPKS